MKKGKGVLAWHFTGATLRDGRPIPAIGEWLTHEGPAVMCESGLHASRRLLDAALFAPGGTIHRVECADIVREEDDKLLCRRRRILATIPEDRANQILRLFARICAYTVIDKWDAPEIVRRYLETGDESLREAARAAAWAPVRAPVREAARAAAWATARAPAWAPVREAARAAAWAAAWAPAWAPVREAARETYDRELGRIVLDEMGLHNG